MGWRARVLQSKELGDQALGVATWGWRNQSRKHQVRPEELYDVSVGQRSLGAGALGPKGRSPLEQHCPAELSAVPDIFYICAIQNR